MEVIVVCYCVFSNFCNLLVPDNNPNAAFLLTHESLILLSESIGMHDAYFILRHDYLKSSYFIRLCEEWSPAKVLMAPKAGKGACNNPCYFQLVLILGLVVFLPDLTVAR